MKRQVKGARRSTKSNISLITLLRSSNHYGMGASRGGIKTEHRADGQLDAEEDSGEAWKRLRQIRVPTHEGEGEEGKNARAGNRGRKVWKGRCGASHERKIPVLQSALRERG